MNAIEIKDLNVHLDDFYLKDINLTLPEGCIVGLIGENGAGKSTLIKAMLDLHKVSYGTIELLGKPYTDKDIKNDIGVVLSNSLFNDNYTVEFVNELLGSFYKRWDEEFFFEYLERYKISRYKRLRELSKGMRMKVDIAAALAHDPKLLILDEPTSGLDPIARNEFVNLLNEFTRDEKKSVLISSHITTDFDKICDYVVFMQDGQIILNGEKDDICYRYCVINCTEKELENLPEDKILYTDTTSYGTRVFIHSDFAPKGYNTYKPNIEDLYIAVVKEGKRK